MGSLVQATFTPAATSHTTPATIGTAQQFPGLNIGPGGCVKIISASLRIDGSAETSTWTLHLYDATPPSAFADGASFSIAAGDRANYLGLISLIQTVTFGASQFIETLNVQKIVRARSTGLWGYLVNGTTLTPGAVAHVVTLGLEGAE